MKKLLGFILSALALLSCTFAINQPSIGSNITKNTSNSFFPANQCVDGGQFYLTWHNYVGDSFTFEDTFWASDSGYHYIFDNSSIITVSDPYNVFNFNGGSNFSWKSNGKPKYVSPYPYEVIFVQKAGSFKTGSLLNGGYNGGVTAQISVRLKRGAFYENSNGSNYTISWFPFGGTSQQSHQRKLLQYGGNTLYSGLECFNYVVHYCGDGVKDTHSSMASYTNGSTHTYGNNNSVANEVCDDGAQNGQPGHCNTSCNGYVPSGPVCGNGILEAGEQCEKHNGSFLPGCSNCQLQAPTCTVSVNPNQGSVPKNVTITKTMSSWATVVYLNVGEGSNITNPNFPYYHTYNNPGSYQIKLKVRNNYDSYGVPYNADLNSEALVARCYANFTGTNPAPVCGNGILEAGEQCEKHNGSFLPGCSNCQLQAPTCTVSVNPNQGSVPKNVTITKTMSSWATVVYLNVGEGSNITNPNFPYYHTYNNPGSYQIKLKVRNNYDSYGVPYNADLNSEALVKRCYANFTGTTPAPYCGDGILQSNEQCDPGSGNFGNGCSSNCQLTTPNCTLTVNPNSGTKPLNTTVNGTKPSWAIYTTLNFGDGQQQSNPNLPVNHIYNSVGTFNLTLTVQNNYNGSIHGTRPTATCSASVNVTNPAPQCGNGTLEAGEQCDPGSNNFGNGCSNNCQLTVPSCTLTVNPNQGAKPLTTTINGTKPNWAVFKSLSYGDNSATTQNPTFPRTHTYNQIGTFNLTLTVQNNYNGQINGTRPTATCSASVNVTNPAPTPYCGDGILQSNEQCDPGSGNFGNGCSSNCQLTTPNCTLTVNPNSGTKPLNTTINGTKPNWATYTNLNFGDGQHQSNPNLPVNHIYNSVGTFNLTLTVQNNYNGSINGTRPTKTCSASVNVSNPAPQGRLKINKYLITTGNFPIGSQVAYKIVLQNIGAGVYHNAYIEDAIPRSLQYVSSNLQGVGNSYQFYEWDDSLGQHHVKYYNFDLQPNQQAVLYLTGILLDYDDLVNCGTANSGLQSCVIISPKAAPYVKKRQKVGNMNFTDQLIEVAAGNDIVYKIDFANVGGRTGMGTVKDYLPECVTYVDASIHGVVGAVFISEPNNSAIGYTDFVLAAGQTGYMLVTGHINTNGSCAEKRYYLNTGSFTLTNSDSDEIFSTVEAERPKTDPSVVIFDKTGNKKTMYPSETGLEFYITVTNQGPNSISNIDVTDIWPNQNSDCIIYEGWTGDNLQYIENGENHKRHYIGRDGVLLAKESFNFTIYASIANNPSCVGSYVNTGKLTYTDGGETHTLYDDYPFQVVEIPNIKISITKTADNQYKKHGETVTYTITYTNNGTVPLTNYVIKDYRPAMVEFKSSTPFTNDIVTTELGSTITWHFNTTLNPGDSGTIIAVGKVK